MNSSQRNTLVTSFYKNPSTFDPRKSGDTTSSAAIFLLFKGLTRLQSNHEVIFDLAESLQVSSNGTRYVFQLGEHYWSDGREISAWDFENSWKKLLSPQFPSFSAHLFYPIKNAGKAKKGQVALDKVGIYAENSKTLIVELEHPVPYFLELVSFCNFFPVPSHREEQFSSSLDETFVSSGPFQLMKWKPNQELFLKKNPLARNPFGVFLENIQIHIISDEKEAFSRFDKGELDWCGEPFSPPPLNYLPAIFERWENQPIGGVTLCFFNTEQLPFSNRKLRQAFAYAIQREKILSKLYLPHCSVAKGLVPPILKGNHEKEFFPAADLPKAQELFHAGLQELKRTSKKLPIVLTFEASEIGFQIAKCLKNFWEEAFSIPIHLEPLDFKVFYDRLYRRQYMLSFTQWMAQYHNPMNILERFQDQKGGKNFSGWESAEYRLLLERCLKQSNPEKRIELVEQAEKILSEEMPIAPLYYFSFSYLKKPYLKNLLFSPIGRVYLEQAFFDGKTQLEQNRAHVI